MVINLWINLHNNKTHLSGTKAAEEVSLADGGASPPPHPTMGAASLVQMQRRCVFVREYAGTSKPSKKTLYERQCVRV